MSAPLDETPAPLDGTLTPLDETLAPLDKTPVKCADCHGTVPKYICETYKGHCMSCDIARWSGWKGPGFCYYCHSTGRLPPIGNARANGALHDDWDSRLYHKKCWQRLKKDRE